MKIAVVGSGISGLSCAYRLIRAGNDVHLYEAGSHFGGHSHTVDVTLEGVTHGVDTGFLVFNHRTYPLLTALFDELGVSTAPSEMGFSVKMPTDGRMLEWAGGDLDQVFCQRGNLLRPAFLRMLRDILRFNRAATALVHHGAPQMSLGSYLDAEGYSTQFRQWYLLPMAACIWSCPAQQMLEFPLSSFVQFCHNHGLLQVNQRPQWHTVRGGSREYVRHLLAALPRRHLNTPVQSVARDALGLTLTTAHGGARYDQVVLACHSDQSLALLRDATDDERDVLSAVRYQPNRALLHTDTSCLPAQRKAWSAWNYQGSGGADQRVCVHYLINKLQPLPFEQPLIVSLNPIDEPRAECVLQEFSYAHPVFDEAAVAAQRRLHTLQGRGGIWFAGAWTGYGFHEDGLKSGLAVAAAIVSRAAQVARAA
ncbi:FAD-dependent oxidoreductase [Pseudoduganella sp. FT25W]|uniref:FAD-dependent oxidoreductase n=1 Tax=Duganella alba TaxID=2666081 RepID=A0A6L5QDU1_9BURK|nr:FAD-dependent oxidoreductase [Duganella alba]MRX07907.1 FAD-dependent oxidoreductase [Duganella alba]MRX15510.1 FAD-dependent oxidoreductase [Duganella alba]